jgi:hypothetical protein
MGHDGLFFGDIRGLVVLDIQLSAIGRLVGW